MHGALGLVALGGQGLMQYKRGSYESLWRSYVLHQAISRSPKIHPCVTHEGGSMNDDQPLVEPSFVSV